MSPDIALDLLGCLFLGKTILPIGLRYVHSRSYGIWNLRNLLYVISKGNPVFSSKTNLLENKDSQGDLYSRGRRIRTLNKGFGDQSSQTLKPLYFQCFQALLQEE